MRGVRDHLSGRTPIKTDGYKEEFLCRRDRLPPYLKDGYTVIHDDGDHVDAVLIGRKVEVKAEVKKEVKVKK